MMKEVMNAYELAKLLEVDSWYKLVTREEISDMLRQQADRIAELEAQLEHAHGIGEANGFIKGHKAQEDRILELEAEVKELHKIAQVMALKESDARKSLHNSKDRIAELEQTIKAYAIRPRGKSDIQPFADVISQQADRIAELEKELYFKNYYEELPDTPVGIYTTPQTKPLSDEEIDRTVDATYGVPRNPVTYKLHRRLARAIEERILGK